MSGESHVIELLPEYALGICELEDEIYVSEHLAACERCREELAAYEAVTARLAYTVPDATPPSQLKQQLLTRVTSKPATGPAEPKLTWREKLAGLWRRAAPAWGAVSLVLILIMGVTILALRQQVDESAVPSSGMRIVALGGTEAAPGAAGTLVISADGEHGSLVVDGLSPLGDALQYQLWLIKDGQRTDGGVFSVNDDGYGVLWIWTETPLSDFPSFGVTIEPAGGSPGPTGDKVLGGSL